MKTLIRNLMLSSLVSVGAAAWADPVFDSNGFQFTNEGIEDRFTIECKSGPEGFFFDNKQSSMRLLVQRYKTRFSDHVGVWLTLSARLPGEDRRGRTPRDLVLSVNEGRTLEVPESLRGGLGLIDVADGNGVMAKVWPLAQLLRGEFGGAVPGTLVQLKLEDLRGGSGGLVINSVIPVLDSTGVRVAMPVYPVLANGATGDRLGRSLDPEAVCTGVQESKNNGRDP